MGTFKSEVQRVVRELAPANPSDERLAHTLVWVLYARGDLKKRKRNRGRRPWRQPRVFRGGSYLPTV